MYERGQKCHPKSGNECFPKRKIQDDEYCEKIIINQIINTQKPSNKYQWWGGKDLADFPLRKDDGQFKRFNVRVYVKEKDDLPHPRGIFVSKTQPLQL